MNHRQKQELELCTSLRFLLSLMSLLCFFIYAQNPISNLSFLYYRDEMWMAINQVTLCIVSLLAYCDNFSSFAFIQPLRLYVLIDVIVSWLWAFKCIEENQISLPFIGEYIFVFCIVVIINTLFKFFFLIFLSDVQMTIYLSGLPANDDDILLMVERIEKGNGFRVVGFCDPNISIIENKKPCTLNIRNK